MRCRTQPNAGPMARDRLTHSSTLSHRSGAVAKEIEALLRERVNGADGNLSALLSIEKKRGVKDTMMSVEKKLFLRINFLDKMKYNDMIFFLF